MRLQHRGGEWTGAVGVLGRSGEKAQEGGDLLEAAEVRTDQAIRTLNSELGDEVDLNENHGLCKGHFYVFSLHFPSLACFIVEGCGV